MKKTTIEKRMIEVEVPVVVEEDGQGLSSLLGKRVLLMCANYFYDGKLIGVNAEDVILEDAGIVYETGEFGADKYKDFQRLPSKEWRVRVASIESYGESNKVG